MKQKNSLIREYRNQGGCDPWGDAMSAWFAVAHELYARDAIIPDAWEFKPGCTTTPDNARDEDNYWFEVFVGISNADLIKFGNILERYTRLIKHAGEDY